MTERTYIPVSNIFEKEEAFMVLLSMPGADKESINVEINGNTLLVTSKAKEEEEGWSSLSREFQLGYYRRSFSIGNQIDREKIDAIYENGILKLILPKSEEAKPKKIAVKASS